MKISKLLVLIAVFVMSITFIQANGYTRGYDHGCSSAKGYWQKNRYAFNNNNRYRLGWLAGERDCTRRVNRGYNAPPPARGYNNRYSQGEYQLGYQHGCRTSESYYTRNRYKYNNSRGYRRGWEEGRQACMRRY
ncbi:MAG: hypothetical protein KU28_03250 [Sulfurovum sp. PC08-66]|nr:MAG: hypothetical protein KU28_03250 [Sulfurovum sp. PC08-66]